MHPFPFQPLRQSARNANLENVLDGVESVEELRCLVVARIEAAVIAVDHCREDELRSRRVAADAAEHVGNADELLHLTIVLRLDLLHRRPELDSLATRNTTLTMTDKHDVLATELPASSSGRYKL